MVTSPANERVKYARSLHRERVRTRDGRFLIEGVRLLEEALQAGARPVLAFYTESLAASENGQALLARLRTAGGPVIAVTEQVMSSLSDTVTAQGVLAIVPIPEIAPLPAGPAVVLDSLRDPGNMGTILRTAWAAGASQVISLRGTVDPYAPKVVRSAMGAHFHVPIRAGLDAAALAQALVSRRLLLAHPAGRPYWQIDWSDDPALVIGGEASGSQLAVSLPHERVAVPMVAGVESLNAAVATAVLLFEALRQRIHPSDVKRQT